jgi:hypothetical protein
LRACHQQVVVEEEEAGGLQHLGEAEAEEVEEEASLTFKKCMAMSISIVVVVERVAEAAHGKRASEAGDKRTECRAACCFKVAVSGCKERRRGGYDISTSNAEEND